MSDFTERQLRLLHQALRIATEDGSISAFGKPWEIESLQADIAEAIALEEMRKRERRKSLAIERKASRM